MSFGHAKLRLKFCIISRKNFQFDLDRQNILNKGETLSSYENENYIHQFFSKLNFT
jgi:hypothetical protein